MNKIAISLIALVALSTASFSADSRSNNERESDTYFIRNSSQLTAKAASVDAIAVLKKNGAPSSFDRMKWEEDRGGKN